MSHWLDIITRRESPGRDYRTRADRFLGMMELHFHGTPKGDQFHLQFVTPLPTAKRVVANFLLGGRSNYHRYWGILSLQSREIRELWFSSRLWLYHFRGSGANIQLCCRYYQEPLHYRTRFSKSQPYSGSSPDLQSDRPRLLTETQEMAYVLSV